MKQKSSWKSNNILASPYSRTLWDIFPASRVRANTQVTGRVVRLFARGVICLFARGVLSLIARGVVARILFTFLILKNVIWSETSPWPGQSFRPSVGWSVWLKCSYRITCSPKHFEIDSSRLELVRWETWWNLLPAAIRFHYIKKPYHNPHQLNDKPF